MDSFNGQRKKKIMVFLPSWGLGGSTLYLSQFVDYYITRGDEVYCICRRKDKGSNYLAAIGAKILYIFSPLSLSITASEQHNNCSFLKILNNLYKCFIGFVFSIFLILKFNPDLVFIGEFTLLQVFVATKLLGKKDIIAIQTSFSIKRSKNFIIQKLLSYSYKIIGITQLHIQQLANGNKNRYYIHNCINKQNSYFKDFDVYFKSLKICTQFIIIFLGGVSRIKGTYSFVTIASEILKKHNNVTFLVAGAYNSNFFTEFSNGSSNSDYYYNKQVFDFIYKNNLQTKILFLDETKYAMQLIEKSTILFSMNDYPHFSRPIIEAWSEKKPVIANNDIFGEYLIENNTFGLMAEKGNINEWVEKSSILLKDHDLRNSYGMKGYQKYLDFFSTQSIWKQMKIILD